LSRLSNVFFLVKLCDAVNIGGLFVLERWITPNLVEWGNRTGIIDQHSFSQICQYKGNCDILRKHWATWYTQEDFDHMKESGLNAIRLPVGYWYFEEISGYSSKPYINPVESIFARKFQQIIFAIESNYYT
jgi:aryl-phospho-beta-D-glucosidase BglC (GH1 family)